MPLVLNGIGTVTGLAAGGLPDATITQSELVSGVVGNGPAFSAYLGSNQSISNNTFTKVLINTEEYDTNSCFDTSTSRFTPNIAGYYQITVAAQITGGGGGYIYRNGASFKNFSSSSGGTALLYLNGSTDYAEYYVYQATGTTQTIVGMQIWTYFQATMVRAA